jgi:hypothetical protein
MDRHLPNRPSLRHLRYEAKALLRDVRAGHDEALNRLREYHPRSVRSTDASLSDAQLVIACEYGFASWPRLKAYVERLAAVEQRVAEVRDAFARGDALARRKVLAAAHTPTRFANYDPDAASLSEADARLLVANEKGYAFWQKYDSYLHLEPAVQQVIDAVRCGDRSALQAVLHASPLAANPKWVTGYALPAHVPNDSIPLFCVSEGAFRRTNTRKNEYELTVDLVAAGANVEIEGGLPLTGAVSFGILGTVEALLEGGANVDGVDADGTPMAYAMHFGFVGIAELLAARRARLDLRFAAGLGMLDVVNGWFEADESLKPGAGALVDPYALERKVRGESPYRCERTRENILNQALYFACRNARLDVAAALVQRGADINAIVPGLDSKATILHLVAGDGVGRGELDEVVRFLLDHGARLDIRDREYGATPLGWAVYLKRENAARLFRALGATE